MGSMFKWRRGYSPWFGTLLFPLVNWDILVTSNSTLWLMAPSFLMNWSFEKTPLLSVTSKT